MPKSLALKTCLDALEGGLDVGYGGRLHCGVWFFCGIGGMGAVGLGLGNGLPLFTVCSWG